MTLMTSEKKEKIINIGSLQDLMLVEKQREKCKIKWLIGLQIFTTSFILLMMGIFYLVNYPTINNTYVSTNITQNVPIQKEDIVTLYALDPLARTFCFSDAKYGQIISNGSVYNRRSDIDFNNYYRGNFSVGIEGGRVGIIIDLGTSADLQKKYKYQETVGNGQGFASIHRENTTILILKNNSYDHTYQPMEESKQLFREGQSGAIASVNLGHLYLLRITDRSDTTFKLIVKMLVIAYKPYESVTIRWEVLE